MVFALSDMSVNRPKEYLCCGNPGITRILQEPQAQTAHLYHIVFFGELLIRGYHFIIALKEESVIS